MIGNVADISFLFKGDGECRGVVRLAAHASRRLRTAYKMVLIVADLRADTVPVCSTLQGFGDGEHYWTHSW